MATSDTSTTESESTASYDTDATPAQHREQGVALIQEMVETADACGVVVNLSGGIDSSTTAALAVEAVGADNVYGLCLPTLASTDANMRDAHTVATELEIAHDTVELQPVLDLFEDKFAPELSTNGDRHAIGNVAARLRMACAYYVANTTNSLVVGTGNRTEQLLGYFTKHGDSGVDLHPLGDCYKTDVRRLARTLGIPAEIIEKPPTAGLWAGQTDETELGASYQVLDPVCHQLIDTRHSVTEVAELLHLDPSTVRQYADRNDRTTHKRTLPTVTSRRLIEDITTTTPNTNPTTAFVAGREMLLQLHDALTAIIETEVTEAGAAGVVVNMSGGVDSSVAAALAVAALGADHVHGLVLPCGKATEAATFDAVELAESLGIEYTMMNLHPLVTRIEDVLPDALTTSATVRSHGNLVARIRMLCAYYMANTTDRLVLGTTTRSEWLTGYFTKYGDGGVDLQPLIGLYKTELRALARTMEIPPTIIEKPPTAGFHVNQTDESELGMAYDMLDELLWYLVDTDAGIDHTAKTCGVTSEVVEQYAHRHLQTRHKRRLPPTPATRETKPAATFFHELELLFGE